MLLVCANKSRILRRNFYKPVGICAIGGLSKPKPALRAAVSIASNKSTPSNLDAVHAPNNKEQTIGKRQVKMLVASPGLIVLRGRGPNKQHRTTG